MTEAKTLRKEIARIAADYDLEWKGELENLEETDSPIRRAEIETQMGPSASRLEQSDTDSQEKHLDIDATIDEADELASQTEERRIKEKTRQRKGELPVDPEEKATKPQT